MSSGSEALREVIVHTVKVTKHDRDEASTKRYRMILTGAAIARLPMDAKIPLRVHAYGATGGAQPS